MNNNDHKNLENEFNVLRFINKTNTNQKSQKLASLVNLICLQQLKKGFVKINNFKKNENKSILYLLTPRGIMEKTKITLAFMRRKWKNMMNKKKLKINKNSV